MYWTLYVVASYIVALFIVRRFFKGEEPFNVGVIFLAAPISVIVILVVLIGYLIVQAAENIGKLILKTREKQ